MIKFELVDMFKTDTNLLPVRATEGSAGYDLCCACDIVIPSLLKNYVSDIVDSLTHRGYNSIFNMRSSVELHKVKELLRGSELKPTLVPTGVKSCFPSNVKLSVKARSSVALHHLLIVANGEGIIDSDYYNNTANEGHIHVMFLNLSPVDIQLRKGDRIAQAVFNEILFTTDDDPISKVRVGGFGSTNESTKCVAKKDSLHLLDAKCDYIEVKNSTGDVIATISNHHADVALGYTIHVKDVQI